MTKEKIKQILNYCEPHLDQMWAASIVGIVLDCDFRDSKAKLDEYKNPTPPPFEPEVESKDIYLKSPQGEIVGLHAIGHIDPDYEMRVQELDGSVIVIKPGFVEYEKWGNEYDNEYNMLGRGSFRVFDLTLDHAAKCWEDDGWVRFERAK